MLESLKISVLSKSDMDPIWLQTSGASVGMIAGAVIAGVAAMLVALALFTTYRRRRSHSRHVYMGAKGATGRTSGSVTTCHALKPQYNVHLTQTACVSMLYGWYILSSHTCIAMICL